MFLRATNRKKDGKDHRYFSVVENRRVAGGKTIQRTVLYLGEINDQQQAAWRKTMAVFDEQQQRYTNLSLFPEARPDKPAGQPRARVAEAPPAFAGRAAVGGVTDRRSSRSRDRGP
jgi:hypothetical protein